MARFCSENKKYCHLIGVRLANSGSTYAVREFGRKVYYFDIAHDPEHRTRIVFPLSQPIPLKDGTRTIADFKAIYHAHGRSVFGDAYSTESQNPARLHYLPSHPLGKTGEAYRFEGDAVIPSEIWMTGDLAVRVEPKSRAAGSRSATPSGTAGLEELAHALKSIPPELEYPDWFKCIAAVFYETKGSDAGLELAHEWSSGDPRYDFAQVDGIWDDLDLDHANPAKVGTLIKLARKFDSEFAPYKAHKHQEVDKIQKASIHRSFFESMKGKVL